MRSPIALLRFIAKAVINAAAGGLPIGDFLVDVVPEIGRDAWDAWAGSRTEAERRAEIEAVVLIPDSEAPMLAAQIAGEVAAGQSEEVRQLVIGYLTMVPAAARASLRRRSDPSGTTVPPDLVPRSGDELIRFLPTRLPRFKPGDRGIIRYERKDYAAAIADYDQAIRLDPKDAAAYYNRGQLRDDRKDYAAAIADFDQAIRLNPKHVAAYTCRGISRKAIGDLDRAVSD